MPSNQSAPTYKMNIPEAPDPTLYQSIIPEKDFALARELANKYKEGYQDTVDRRNKMVGSVEEIGQRMKEREARTAASYLASLPKPEIDYTAGIEPDVMNKVDVFLAKLNKPDSKDPYNFIQPGDVTDSSSNLPPREEQPPAQPAPPPPTSSAPAPTPSPSAVNNNKTNFVGPLPDGSSKKPIIIPSTRKLPQKSPQKSQDFGIRELTKEEHAEAAAGAKSLKEYLENQQKIRARTKPAPIEYKYNQPKTPSSVPIQDNRPSIANIDEKFFFKRFTT